MPYQSKKRKYSSGYMSPAKRARIARAVAAQARGGYAPTVAARYGNIRTGGFVGQELKFFDSARTALALTAPTDAAGGEVDPATVNCLFAPTQGTGAQNRDGRRVQMRSIQITGEVSCAAQTDQTVLDVPPKILLALVLDKQTNATQLSSEDVFTNPSGAANLAASPLRDLERSTRFKVLKQWTIQLTAPQVGWDGTNLEQAGVTRSFSWYGRVNIPVEFLGNAGNIADIQDNSVHMVGYCSTVALAPTVSYNCRIRFVG